METLNYRGKKVLSMIIFASAYHLQKHFDNDMDSNILFARSSTGYSNNKLGLVYLKHFNWFTKSSTKGSYCHSGASAHIISRQHFIDEENKLKKEERKRGQRMMLIIIQARFGLALSEVTCPRAITAIACWSLIGIVLMLYNYLSTTVKNIRFDYFSYLCIIHVMDQLRGGWLGVALYSRIAIRVANSNIVPFWLVS